MDNSKQQWPSEEGRVTIEFQAHLNMDNSKQQWPSEEGRSTIECQVHLIHMGDVEDPDLFVAEPIYQWQQTEKGKYIMEHSRPKPIWVRTVNHNTYGYDYKIKAYLTPEQLTYYRLKYE